MLFDTLAFSRGVPNHFLVYPDFYLLFDHDHRDFRHRFWGTFTYALAKIINLAWNRYMISYYPTLVDQEFNFMDFDTTGAFAFVETPQQFDLPRSLTPDIKFVSDATKCGKAKPLPENYRNFVEDPKSKGTIIAAFGHVVKWRNAPEPILNQFWSSFENLTDYRIIWQYNGPILRLHNSNRSFCNQIHFATKF